MKLGVKICFEVSIWLKLALKSADRDFEVVMRGGQKEKIVEVVLDYLGDKLQEGTSARELLSPEDINYLTDKIEEGFRDRSIPVGEKILNNRMGPDGASHYSLRHYAKNILHNWLNKDPRLNGGSRENKNTLLSKALKNDPILKTLRTKIEIEDDPEREAKLTVDLDCRVEKIKSRRFKSVIVHKCLTDNALDQLFKLHWSYEDDDDPDWTKRKRIQDEIVCQILDIEKKTTKAA